MANDRPRAYKTDDGRQGEFVQGLARGLDVMGAFGRDRGELTLADVARATGLSRAAARRSLLTLVALGYARSDGRLFSLTPKVLTLGHSYLASHEIGNHVQPILRQAADVLGEACAYGVLEGDEMVCVAHAPGAQRVLTVGLAAGSRMPLLNTAIGRALLAHLPDGERARLLASAPLAAATPNTVTDRAQLAQLLEEVARRGYAVVDEEFEPGVRALGVPVLDHDGAAVGAVNVVVSAGRASVDQLRTHYLPIMRRCAEALGLALS